MNILFLILLGITAIARGEDRSAQVKEIEKNLGKSKVEPLIAVSGPMLNGLVGTVYFDDAPTSALSPPPCDIDGVVLKFHQEKGVVGVEEVKIPNAFQRYIQDEFMAMGWWTFIVFGAIFWIGIWFAYRGDWYAVGGAFGVLLFLFNLLAYAFRQK